MMPSAADFLPSYIRLFMNLARTRSPYLASGLISRRSARWRRDIVISLLRALGAVERTALLAVLDALGVEHAADDVIAHARKVLDAAAADQDDAMFLKVVALAGNISERLISIRQAHLGDLAQSRIRLLGRGRVDAGADGALLRAALERRHLVALRLFAARLANELVDRRHSLPFCHSRGHGMNETKKPDAGSSARSELAEDLR